MSDQLSLPECGEIKINKSKSMSDLPPEQQKTKKLKQKVSDMLNKWISEQVNDLVDQIINLQIYTPEKINEAIILRFAKTIVEPNFFTSYGGLCSKLAESLKNIKEVNEPVKIENVEPISTTTSLTLKETQNTKEINKNNIRSGCNANSENKLNIVQLDAAYNSIKPEPVITEIVPTEVVESSSEIEIKSSDIIIDLTQTNSSDKTKKKRKKKKKRSLKTVEDAVIAETVTESAINYKDGQWSPQNKDGLRQYDRLQLLQLRESVWSQKQPNNINKKTPESIWMDPIKRFLQQQEEQNRSSMSGPSNKGSTSSKLNIIQDRLSRCEDIKLNESETAWRLKHFLQADLPPEQLETEEIKRKVRGILNKLTPEKFDDLVTQVINLQIDTPEKINEVMILVFEKAIDEPNFSASYARLCSKLAEIRVKDDKTKDSPAFRSALLDKTEYEFRINVAMRAAKTFKLQPILDKIKECTDPQQKLELEANLEEEERKIRRRSGGTVRFIGELFNISMLTGNIMRACIENLLRDTSEDKLECLCKLLTTVGQKFELTPMAYYKHRPTPQTRHYNLDEVIEKLEKIAYEGKIGSTEINSEIRVMIQDVIALRKNKWITSRTIDTNKLGQMLNYDVDTTNQQSDSSSGTSNPYAPLSGLDANKNSNNDSNLSLNQSGGDNYGNKDGNYNKGSLERDSYNESVIGFRRNNHVVISSSTVHAPKTIIEAIEIHLRQIRIHMELIQIEINKIK